MKNETAKITDYIWYIMHVDVQGWKGEVEEKKRATLCKKERRNTTGGERVSERESERERD